MTRKDFILIAECVAECHNEKYELDEIIGYFIYRLHRHSTAKTFDATKFREFIYQRTKPEHIPEEQAKTWAIKKSRKT